MLHYSFNYFIIPSHIPSSIPCFSLIHPYILPYMYCYLVALAICDMSYWSITPVLCRVTQCSSVHLTAIPSPFTVKWAPLSLPELRCRFMPEQCRFLHIRWKPCLHIPALSPPSPPSLFAPLSLSSFFLRRHFNMYANGLRSMGRYVWSPLLQSGGVGEIVFVFMRHGPCRSWERKRCE